MMRLIGVFALTIGALSLVGCEPGPRYPKKSKKELAERARIKAAGEKYWADMPEYNYYKIAGHYYQVPTKKHTRRLILGDFHSREPKLIRETTRLTMERCCEGVEYYFPVKATNGSSFFQGGFVVGDSAIDHITGFHPVKNFHFLDTSSERHYSKFPSFTDQFYLISWKKNMNTIYVLVMLLDWFRSGHFFLINI